MANGLCHMKVSPSGAQMTVNANLVSYIKFKTETTTMVYFAGDQSQLVAGSLQEIEERLTDALANKKTKSPS